LRQLERLKNLAVLKLDGGRQQPVEEMWEGECVLEAPNFMELQSFYWTRRHRQPALAV
jgi:hypothetical protein